MTPHAIILDQALGQPTPVRHTERTVLDLLRERHSARHGNGPEWAYMEHVRNAAGFAATRTADAMALGLWPSRGHELHAYEVKVSRSDWRRELADGAKADAWHGIIDRWWIVAPVGVVPRAELPALWGLLEVNATGEKLRQVVAAPLLTEGRPPVDRSLLVCMLRAAGAGLTTTPDKAALEEARQAGREEGRKAQAQALELLQDRIRSDHSAWEEDRRIVSEIGRALGGIQLRGTTGGVDRLSAIADAVRAVLGEDAAALRAKRAVDAAAQQLELAATYIREHVGKY